VVGVVGIGVGKGWMARRKEPTSAFEGHAKHSKSDNNSKRHDEARDRLKRRSVPRRRIASIHYAEI
jgi:hypothetical protein